jgi:hypothetical protein
MWGQIWDKDLVERRPRRWVNRWKSQFYHFPNGPSVPQYPLFTRVLARSYFREFQKIAQNGFRVVSDMTPHYAAISAKNLATISTLIQQNGFTPRVLFIMRDPVERVIAGVLHSHRRLTSARNAELVQLVASEYRSYSVRVRTRYDYTIENLERVFRLEDVKTVFFEDLFTPRSMAGIADWLGISPINASFDQKIGSQRLQVTIPDSLRHDIRRYYHPVYEYCSEKFGEAELTKRWKNF